MMSNRHEVYCRIRDEALSAIPEDLKGRSTISTVIQAIALAVSREIANLTEVTTQRNWDEVWTNADFWDWDKLEAPSSRTLTDAEILKTPALSAECGVIRDSDIVEALTRVVSELIESDRKKRGAQQ